MLLLKCQSVTKKTFETSVKPISENILPKGLQANLGLKNLMLCYVKLLGSKEYILSEF